jgi:hypothetical protein
MIRFGKYGPALVALVFAGLTALASAMTDGHVDRVEGVQIAIQVATVAGVWLVPIVPGWTHAKTAIALILAALNFATTTIGDGFSGLDWVNLAVAAVGVLAVGLTVPPDSLGGRVPAPRAYS